LALQCPADHTTPKKEYQILPRSVEAVSTYQAARLWVANHINIQISKPFRYIPSKQLLTAIQIILRDTKLDKTPLDE
jgi:hypothetical protein